jgi:RNA polymerase sigma factor for flagellar operon FliA
MTLADYQKMLQSARGHQLVYLEDLISEEGEDFLERHQVEENSRSGAALRGRERTRQALVRAIADLPEREKLMMALYYEQDLNLREIGEVMGVSESRVCQLHSQAVMRLAHAPGWRRGQEAKENRKEWIGPVFSAC